MFHIVLQYRFRLKVIMDEAPINLTSSCENVGHLATNIYFLLLLLVRLIVLIAAIVLFIVLLKFQNIRINFHVNSKMLLLSHHFSALVHCVMLAAQHSFDLWRFSMFAMNEGHRDPCDLLSTYWRCAIFRVPITIAYCATGFTFLMLAIERILATVQSRVYEGRQTTIGYVLVVVLVREVLYIKRLFSQG